MEQGALAEWAHVLDKNPDVSFVYSDYRFTVTDMGMIAGQEFDPWTLRCNNYISTMSPIRVTANPKFDEKLASLQDWDLWLTLAERGHKGKYLPGVRFWTVPPKPGSISGEGCTPDKWLERKGAVKEKHSIKDKDICFASLSCYERAVELAKMFDNADAMMCPGFNVHKYKMVYLLGFYPQNALEHAEVFRNGPQGMRKVVHWLGGDVQALYDMVPVGGAFNMADILNRDYINLCETARSRGMLKRVGIHAHMVRLPVRMDGLPNKPPLEMRVVYDADPPYADIIKAVVDAFPDVPFTLMPQVFDMSQYGILVRLSSLGMLDETCKKYLAAGFPLVSNIPESQANYVSDMQPADMAVRALVRTIRHIMSLYDTYGSHHPSAVLYRRELANRAYTRIVNDILDAGMLWKARDISAEQEVRI